MRLRDGRAASLNLFRTVQNVSKPNFGRSNEQYRPFPLEHILDYPNPMLGCGCRGGMTGFHLHPGGGRVFAIDTHLVVNNMGHLMFRSTIRAEWHHEARARAYSSLAAS